MRSIYFFMLSSTVAMLTVFDVRAACDEGAYTAGREDIVVIVSPADPQQTPRYLFLDGRRGNVAADSGRSAAMATLYE